MDEILVKRFLFPDFELLQWLDQDSL